MSKNLARHVQDISKVWGESAPIRGVHDTSILVWFFFVFWACSVVSGQIWIVYFGSESSVKNMKKHVQVAWWLYAFYVLYYLYMILTCSIYDFIWCLHCASYVFYMLCIWFVPAPLVRSGDCVWSACVMRLGWGWYLLSFVARWSNHLHDVCPRLAFADMALRSSAEAAASAAIPHL